MENIKVSNIDRLKTIKREAI